MKRALISIFVILLFLAAGAGASALYFHSQIRTAAGVPIKWKTMPVKFVIQSAGSDNINDASDDAAIRLAFQAWQDASTSNITFKEDTNPDQRARTDYESTDIHLIIFDENNSTGEFTNGAGIIGLTPISFFTSPASVAGNIADGDIIFNGKDFNFSTDQSPSTIDLQSVAAHEVGHFIGLDHEALQAATMYPFLAQQQINLRTLSIDDAAGAHATYPNGANGSIAGFVKRSNDNSAVRGAHIWARDITDGRVASAAYTNDDGSFTITGLPAGNYRLTASAIDGPVSSINYGANTLGNIDLNFQAGQSNVFAVVGTAKTDAGDFLVDPLPAINITTPSKGTTMHAGEMKVIHFTGTLPSVANSEVTIPDSGSNFTLLYSAGNNLSVTAGAQTPAGVYDIFLRDTSNNQKAVHAGAIEVFPPAPNLTNVAPTASATAGGVTVTITGTNLDLATAVIFGDVPGTDLVILSPTQITIKTPAHAAGLVDVIVQTAGGEEDRLDNAFGFGDAIQPLLTSIFPASGGSTGNATVFLSGSDFVDGATVKFGTTAAASVVFVNSGLVEAATPALTAGVYDVIITNPGVFPLASTLAGSFTSVNGTNPIILSADPDTVPYTGGGVVSLNGSGFQSGADVQLFVNLLTGLGGVDVPPDSVLSNVIQITAPAGSVGDATILITNPDGLAAPASGLLNYSAIFNAKGTLKGAVSSGVDTDQIFLDSLAGSKITVTLSQSASALQPKLQLKDSLGIVLMSTDAGDASFNPTFASSTTKTASIKNFILPSSGRFRCDISGAGGTSGKYKCTIRETLPASAKSANATKLAVGGAPGVINFLSKSGATIKGKIKASKGLTMSLAAFTGPSGSILGNPDVASKIVVDATGTSIQFNSVPLAELGAYSLTIASANAAVGTVSGSLKITTPKLVSSLTEQ
ncbi:MAG: IPT/TIG domain-containing protein [Planctomycetota bacterium]